MAALEGDWQDLLAGLTKIICIIHTHTHTNSWWPKALVEFSRSADALHSSTSLARDWFLILFVASVRGDG